MRMFTSVVKATDTQARRIKVRDAGSNRYRTMSWDYGVSDPHQAAAERFSGKRGRKVGDRLNGYVFDTIEEE